MDGLNKKQQKKVIPPSKIHGLLLPNETNDISHYASEDHSFYPKKRPSIPKRKHSLKRFFFFLFFSLFLLILFSCAILIYKGASLGREIQIENTSNLSLFADMKDFATSIITTKNILLSGEETGRINILLLGRAGNHYPGKNLTDTIMVLSIQTREKKVALLSLPRDLYVEIPGTQLFTKINALYQYGITNGTGIEPIRTVIEDITGEKIHYFFTLDFDGFEKGIDTLHGISLDVMKDFYDPRYPGKNYSYETFEIKKGWQTLDGATALKYVRERHNDPEGDFGRAKRQQQVISAIKEKAFSLGTFFNIVMVNNLLHVLEESIETDMTTAHMERFLEIIQTLDTKNITTFVVDAWKKESLLRVSHIQVGDITAFILVPRVGTWNEIQDVSSHIFNLEDIKVRKEKIKNEKASLSLITNRQNASTAQKIKSYLLEEVGLEKVEITFVPLENIEEKSIIQKNTDEEKSFSLDELLKKLSLEKRAILPELQTTDTKNRMDFSLLIGNDLIQEFALDQELKDPAQEEDVNFDIIPPQEKHEKK